MPQIQGVKLIGKLTPIIPKNVMEDIDITELVSEMIAPIRPFSYALSFSGGDLKTLKGHHTFFKQCGSHCKCIQ